MLLPSGECGKTPRDDGERRAALTFAWSVVLPVRESARFTPECAGGADVSAQPRLRDYYKLMADRFAAPRASGPRLLFYGVLLFHSWCIDHGERGIDSIIWQFPLANRRCPRSEGSRNIEMKKELDV